MKKIKRMVDFKILKGAVRDLHEKEKAV